MRGTHLLGHWSRTQQCVALSSCEAEINSLIKGGSEGLGVVQMMQQCQESVSLCLKTDASAAIGVCQRSGAGRVKHLSITQLWIQSLLAEGRVQLMKVPRESNMSDLLTHHCTASETSKHLSGVGARRHGETAPAHHGEGAC